MQKRLTSANLCAIIVLRQSCRIDVIYILTKKIGETSIPQSAMVKVTDTGKSLEIAYRSNNNNPSIYTIKRSQSHFEDLRSGAIRESNHSSTRAGNSQSLKRSVRRFKEMAETNIIDTSACCGITLTYHENMQDILKLRGDQKNFNRRLREKWQEYEYLSVMEYQERGSLHAHMIIICPQPIVYLDYKIVQKCWGKKGAVHVDRIQSVSQIINYCVKDKLDLPLEKAKIILGD